jgi:hypothetical protein
MAGVIRSDGLALQNTGLELLSYAPTSSGVKSSAGVAKHFTLGRGPGGSPTLAGLEECFSRGTHHGSFAANFFPLRVGRSACAGQMRLVNASKAVGNGAGRGPERGGFARWRLNTGAQM